MRKVSRIIISFFLIVLTSMLFCTYTFAESNPFESLKDKNYKLRMQMELDSDKDGSVSTKEMYYYVFDLEDRFNDSEKELNKRGDEIEILDKELVATTYKVDVAILICFIATGVLIVSTITTNIILFVKCSKLKKLYQSTLQNKLAIINNVDKDKE